MILIYVANWVRKFRYLHAGIDVSGHHVTDSDLEGFVEARVEWYLCMGDGLGVMFLGVSIACSLFCFVGTPIGSGGMWWEETNISKQQSVGNRLLCSPDGLAEIWNIKLSHIQVWQKLTDVGLWEHLVVHGVADANLAWSFVGLC